MLLPLHIKLKIQELAIEQAIHGKRSFYVYDTSYMYNKVIALKDIMPKQVNIFYAMKANPHEYFLTTAKKSGVKGIEIASLGEGLKCLKAGFSAQDLIFTG